ncbi:HET-domain-containing protein, partial [Cladorrhinum samala]
MRHWERFENGSRLKPPLDAFLDSRIIPQSPNLEHCLEFVRPLLRGCVESHLFPCRQSSRSLQIPRRYVDIENGVRLITTQTAAGAHDWRYIALSHCWGESRLLETKTTNLAQHYINIPWVNLGKTFQDAICLSRGLNVRYIWIDSLCIVQDDPANWKSEALKMASVYSDSYLTIAATGSKNGDGGCFFERSPGLSLSRLSYVHQDEHPVHAQYSSFDLLDSHSDLTWSRYALKQPLLRRAWCFQERLLSPRVLHFHDQEMVWECRTTTACECGFLSHTAWFRSARREQYRSNSRREILGLNAWMKMIVRYSALQLTYESDRLPALSGLAKQFAESLHGKVRYLAGLWENDLWRGLGWASHANTRRSKSLTLPSWSWISM